MKKGKKKKLESENAQYENNMDHEDVVKINYLNTY